MAKSDRPAAPISYSAKFHETAIFHYLLIGFVIISLVVSTSAFIYTTQLKKALIPKTIDANNFLKKLTSHEQMKAYIGVAPLNIIQVTNDNLANIQSQISGLDTSYVGSFIVQYTDGIIVYDYDKNIIKGIVSLQQPQQGQIPADLFIKLNKHPQLNGLQNEQHVGGQLDAASLATLKQQFPDVYKDAKGGDFLLRYKTKLIIYDYNADRIVNAVDLG